MAIARDAGSVTVYYEVAGHLRTYKEVGFRTHMAQWLRGIAELLGVKLSVSVLNNSLFSKK